MKTKIHIDGLEGWAKRARATAKALDEGKKITPSKSITFESPAEMARLLTAARLELFERVKARPYLLQDLALVLKRDVRAVSRDVTALEQYGIVQSEKRPNPGHGVVRVVSAPASITITATL